MSLTSVLVFCLFPFSIGCLGTAVANRKVDGSAKRVRWLKLGTYFLVVYVVLGSALVGRGALVGLFSLILTLGTVELIRVSRSAKLLLRIASVAVSLSLGVVLLAFLSVLRPETPAFIYIVVAGFDGFSQVAGQLFGRWQLAPKISPNKTVEGFAGGVLCAVATGLCLRSLVNLSAAKTTALTLVICLAGLTGDLLLSWMKRRQGVKDFGTLLPAHGGVLDRFDSFLLAAPASFVFLWLAG